MAAGCVPLIPDSHPGTARVSGPKETPWRIQGLLTSWVIWAGEGPALDWLWRGLSKATVIVTESEAGAGLLASRRALFSLCPGVTWVCLPSQFLHLLNGPSKASGVVMSIR